MSTNADQQLLTVAEAATRLQMTPHGVYKLIQKGKLRAVRVSERKTRVTEESVTGYMQESQAWVDRYLAAQPKLTRKELRDAFARETGIGPEQWLAAWKRDEFEDTAENMRLLVRAASLRDPADEAASAPRAKQRATRP